MEQGKNAGSELAAAAPANSMDRFQPIEDVPLTLRAELNRQDISFGELLAFDVGTILPLSRPTGENVDLYVEDVLLGSGEILLVDSAVAVRVVDVREKAVFNGARR